MLIFADYDEGLRVTGQEILPRLQAKPDAERLARACPHRAAADRHAGDFAPKGDGASGHGPPSVQAELLAEAARAAGVACIFVRLITTDESPFFLEWKSRRWLMTIHHSAAKARRARNSSGRSREPANWSSPRTATAHFPAPASIPNCAARASTRWCVAGLTTECCISFIRTRCIRARFPCLRGRATPPPLMTPALHQAALKALELNCAGSSAQREIAGAPGKYIYFNMLMPIIRVSRLANRCKMLQDI